MKIVYSEAYLLLIFKSIGCLGTATDETEVAGAKVVRETMRVNWAETFLLKKAKAI
jgi:hypothetical protein